MENDELTEDVSYSIYEYELGEYTIYRSDLATRSQISKWCKDLFGDDDKLSKLAQIQLDDACAEELSDIRRLIIYPKTDGIYEITEDIF